MVLIYHVVKFRESSASQMLEVRNQ